MRGCRRWATGSGWCFRRAHHLPGGAYREAALLCAAPMRMGLTATPERSDGRHADLADLIGPTVYRQEIREARGRTLADYDVVRIPVALSDEEQYQYDRASATVRSFMLRRQGQLRAEAAAGDEAPGHTRSYTWQDLCAETGSDPEARRRSKPTASRSRSRTARPRNCGCWKTCSGFTPASGRSSSRAPTRWRSTCRGGSSYRRC